MKGQWSLGEMPLTLFIVIAAILVYLRLAGRAQNAPQGSSGAQGGASGGNRVEIPPGPATDPLTRRYGVGPPTFPLQPSDPAIERMRRESGLYGRN